MANILCCLRPKVSVKRFLTARESAAIMRFVENSQPERALIPDQNKSWRRANARFNPGDGPGN